MKARAGARTRTRRKRGAEPLAAKSLCSGIARHMCRVRYHAGPSPEQNDNDSPISPYVHPRTPEMESRYSTSTTPTGSPKRVSVCDLTRQTNTNNVSARPTQTAVNDATSYPSNSKRARPDGPAVDTRDDEFWYLDGTVVIRVHKTLFRIHALRLARYCVYFQRLFESCATDSAGQNETVDRCPVYHVPTELSANEFKDVLRALDTPLYVPAPSFVCPAPYAYTTDPNMAGSSPPTHPRRPSLSPCSPPPCTSPVRAWRTSRAAASASFGPLRGPARRAQVEHDCIHSQARAAAQDPGGAQARVLRARVERRVLGGREGEEGVGAVVYGGRSDALRGALRPREDVARRYSFEVRQTCCIQ